VVTFQPLRIAVVGLGTAGACMLDSLARALVDHTDVSLTLYDPTTQPWRGRVFQDDCDCVLANLTVDRMTIRHGDSGHAERWLRGRGHLDPGSTTDVYLPRQVYGDYIAQHTEGLLQDLRLRGWRVERVEHAASSLARLGASGCVVESEGRREEFDYVILCAGGSVYADPLDLGRSPGYIADPYPTHERLHDIPPDATVGVLGSGLTAVDIAVALKHQGHAGPIRMYSRSGTLPLVRRRGPAWTAKHLTSDRLRHLTSTRGSLRIAEVRGLFEREVQAWGGEPLGSLRPETGTGLQAWLRRQLEQPHDATDLAAFIFQRLIPVGWQDIWYALDVDEQRRILASRLAMRVVMSWCCPMPPVNAERILAMLDSGQLQVAGGLRSVAPGRGGFEVQLTASRQRADHIVNAVTPPPGFGVHPGVRRLVDSAVGQGLARRHHAGGLEVAAASGAVLGGRPCGLYALGDLTRGAFLLTYAIPSIVSRSIDIARAIHRDAQDRVLRSTTALRAGEPRVGAPSL
jgi:uncharacterized NAD(P)/FAD-binding protein YdhS